MENGIDSLMAGIVIVVSAIVMLAAVGVTACSVARSLRVNRRPKTENGVPTHAISLCTAALVLAIALPALLFGSFTDMCIITAITLLLVASIAVILSKILTARLRKRV